MRIFNVLIFQHLIPNANMDMAYGTLVVEGTSWTHPDNIPMQLANTVEIYFYIYKN